MDGINWGIAQNALAQPDPGQRFMLGYQQGQQRAKENALDKAMRYLGQNPDDPNALSQIMRIDPQMGMKLRDDQLQRQTLQTKQQQAQREQAAEAAKLLTPLYQQLAKMPYEQRRQYLQSVAPRLVQRGIPAEIVGQYDPTDENLQADIALGAELAKPTAMQQNYEFLKSQNPQLAEEYLRRQAEQSPLIASNGDGTFTIIPRTGVQASPQGNIPPPPPGFVLDSDGGPAPSAPGTFQP